MSKTTRLVLLHRSEDIESGRKGVLSSVLISELWTDYTVVLVPKSSARQKKKSHGESNAAGRNSSGIYQQEVQKERDPTGRR